MNRIIWTSAKTLTPRYFGVENQRVKNKQTGELWYLHTLKEDGWIIKWDNVLKFATFDELIKNFTDPKDI